VPQPPTPTSAHGASRPAKKRLADLAFDIRSVIGALFVVYGLVCLVWGLVSFPQAAAEKTGGVNLNLWAGLGMLVLGAAFLLWVVVRPLTQDDPAVREALEAETGAGDDEGGRR
jgi:protein-S-isoprenylcysteine O-methyltransferase Ste14